MNAARPTALALLMCAAGAAHGAAADGFDRGLTALSGPRSGVLRAGETVEVVLPRGDPDADEREIFLVLDSGARIRLADVEPGTARLVFRVPNAPSRAASLLVREGGRNHGADDPAAGRFERDLARSGPFAIEGDAAPGLPVPWRDDGLVPRTGDFARAEWRMDARRDAPLRHGEACGPAPDALDSCDSGTDAVTPPWRGVSRAPEGDARDGNGRPGSPSPRRAIPAPFGSRARPLRN